MPNIDGRSVYLSLLPLPCPTWYPLKNIAALSARLFGVVLMAVSECFAVRRLGSLVNSRHRTIGVVPLVLITLLSNKVLSCHQSA